MDERWIVFDTETTDFVQPELVPIASQPYTIEFAGLLIDPNTGEELDSYDQLINPGFDINEVIQKITGLRPENLRPLPRFEGHADAIRAIFAKATHRAAHNLPFDEKMMDYDFARINQEWRPKRQRRVCTVEQTEHLLGYRFKLGDLHAHLFGQPHADAHRAMNDVRATARCIVELRKRGVV